MQTKDPAARDGSMSPTTTTDCGSSTPSKRPRESAPTDVGDCETESQLRKRRMAPDEAPHERMERPNFDEDADSEDDRPQLKFHQQNIVDEAFATFLAKHNIDARVFRSEEWAAVEEAIDQGSAESWSEPVKLLHQAPIDLLNKAAIALLKSEGVWS